MIDTLKLLMQMKTQIKCFPKDMKKDIVKIYIFCIFMFFVTDRKM